MNQSEINQAEWNNPQNWTASKWCYVYFSHKDSRTWVPKRNPKLGWTPNLAKAAGVTWFFGIFSGIVVLVVIAALCYGPCLMRVGHCR